MIAPAGFAWAMGHALAVLHHELLLFAVFWFTVGLLDDVLVDALWLALVARDRIGARTLTADVEQETLSAPVALFIPAFQESGVIATTLNQIRAAWPHPDLLIYVGTYANDPATAAAARRVANSDRRVRVVIHPVPGPTTKADCLNRLYANLSADESRGQPRASAVVLQDAEDMVHPAGLAVMMAALRQVDFVQLPVDPVIDPASRWISAHYADEFTESHTKALPVRAALGAALPAAGVGCAFARDALDRIATLRIAQGEAGPFAPAALTEDYELGILLSRSARGSAMARFRDQRGTLVATRCCFPARIDAAVRQKARWLHGIAFQGWERLGWSWRPAELWMILRDRRGPLAALVMAVAYLLPFTGAAVMVYGKALGTPLFVPLSPLVQALALLGLSGLVWRASWRLALSGRRYGWREGLRAVPRIMVGNVIAIIAARRALAAYLASLLGARVRWDKTDHTCHPALLPQDRV